uniref:Uncharacterized protein n=1 Tax=Mycena chlorophos TaxID=658473 RepID=A0ABQ0LEN2_MYCCL|nr:predicted protein [Mycena chlorophos]
MSSSTTGNSSALAPGDAANQFASDVSFQFDNLWSLTLGTLLYGVYLVLFGLSMGLFVSRISSKRRREGAAKGSGKSGRSKDDRAGSSSIRSWRIAARSPIFMASFALWVATTIVWILTVQRTFYGFVTYNGGVPGSSTAFFSSLSQASETTQNLFIDLGLAIGDAMILYRLWAMWRNWFVVAPALLCWVGFVAAETLAVIDTALGKLEIVANTITSSITLSLATNLYCTVLIWYRVWTVVASSANLEVARTSGRMNLTRIVLIFVESAAGFTLYTVIYFVLHLLNHKLQFGFINASPAAIGIANALIQTRVALAREKYLLSDGGEVDLGSGDAEMTLGSGDEARTGKSGTGLQFAQIGTAGSVSMFRTADLSGQTTRLGETSKIVMDPLGSGSDVMSTDGGGLVGEDLGKKRISEIDPQ